MQACMEFIVGPAGILLLIHSLVTILKFSLKPCKISACRKAFRSLGLMLENRESRLLALEALRISAIGLRWRITQ